MGPTVRTAEFAFENLKIAWLLNRKFSWLSRAAHGLREWRLSWAVAARCGAGRIHGEVRDVEVRVEWAGIETHRSSGC